MAGAEVKNFDRPDETRPFRGKGKAEVVQLGGRTVVRATYEPGWVWRNNVQPIAGTDMCEIAHLAYCVKGHMKVVMTDGQEAEVGPGDVFWVPAGHEGEVVGDEECVWLDFGDLENYAR